MILILFIGAGFLTSNSVQQTKSSTSSFAVSGTPVRAVPAVHDLKVITVSGQPPGNILNAVSIPQGATRVSHANNTQSAQQYDAQISLKSDELASGPRDLLQERHEEAGLADLQHRTGRPRPGGLRHPRQEGRLGRLLLGDGRGDLAHHVRYRRSRRGTTPFIVRLFQQPDPD